MHLENGLLGGRMEAHAAFCGVMGLGLAAVCRRLQANGTERIVTSLVPAIPMFDVAIQRGDAVALVFAVTSSLLNFAVSG